MSHGSHTDNQSIIFQHEPVILHILHALPCGVGLTLKKAVLFLFKKVHDTVQYSRLVNVLNLKGNVR